MIKITNIDAAGIEPALRGMRNPMNSWNNADSFWGDEVFHLGENDNQLATKLASAGPVHGKYLRMITVWMDISAPLYWWKEFDTYKVGTVANSCSTMHKLHAEPLTPEDFSIETLDDEYRGAFMAYLELINAARENYLKTRKKTDWYKMIQMLPSSYNQTRTIATNYETLANIYHYRKNHKLNEWIGFCKMIERLPAFHLIEARANYENSKE